MNETTKALRNKLYSGRRPFESKGLKVDLGKTKVMVSGGITKERLYDKFEIVRKFTHLGDRVSSGVGCQAVKVFLKREDANKLKCWHNSYCCWIEMNLTTLM